MEQHTQEDDKVVNPAASTTDGVSSALRSEAPNNAIASGNEDNTGHLELRRRLVKQPIEYFSQPASGQVNIRGNYGMVFVNVETSTTTTSIYAENNDGWIFIGNNTICNLLDFLSPLPCEMDNSEKKLLKKFFEIGSVVCRLCDNGEWKAFYSDVDLKLKLARQHGQAEVIIFLLIQKSIGLSHEKKNEDALKTVEEAKDMIFRTPGLHMREFLTALALCQLAAIHRRASNFKESNDDVNYALQNLEFKTSRFARALVLYEKACNSYVQYFYHPKLEQVRDSCAERAKVAYKACISQTREVLEENPKVYIQKHQNSLVKCALLNLNFATSAAREQPVSKESISEAGNCICTVEQEGNNLTKCTEMLLIKAKAGLYYRKGDISKAKETAADALRKAKSAQFQVEIHELEDFCNELMQPAEET